MATVTTNNGWDIPQSTDYVKLGADAIAALGQDIDTSVGTGLLTWQTWSPTLSVGWANGNGVWTAKYAQLGKLVFVRGRFVLGSTTTKGTGLVVSLPVTAAANQTFTVNAGLNFATVAAAATNLLMGYLTGTNALSLFAIGTAGTYANRAQITATIPGTWATGDEINFAFTYEAA
jgi:hypothetical protein